jgi:Ca-activated chloride channel homolog
MINWGAQSVLWGLLALPLLGLWLLWLLRRREAGLRLLAAEPALARMLPGRRPGRRRLRLLLVLLAAALLLIALARPQWGFHWREVKRRGLDIMVVLDTSKSMLAEDVRPNRLQQAKWGVRDLVRGLSSDRVGLIAFSGGSFLQCPLTVDYAALLMTLDDLYAGIIPRGGTRIGQALELAMDSFEAETESDKAIILITDGEDHEGDPAGLVAELKERGIRVYAIGVGTLDGEPIPIRNEEGRLEFQKNEEGNVVTSSLNEEPLQRLALETGGIYVRSAPGDFGFERIIEQGIEKLKRSELESRMAKEFEDRHYWFIAAALLLLILENFIAEGRRNQGEVHGNA